MKIFLNKVFFVALFFSVFNSYSCLQSKSRNFNNIREVFDNFYAVEKNMLYRSKQLDNLSLDFYIKKYNIKTVINLRGVNKNKKWWEKEKKVVHDNNAYFFNIAMRAEKFPSKENLRKLIKLYEIAPKPILIHCFYGADRTGEAAAIWKLLRGEQEGLSLNKNKKKALKQLSVRYGHIKKITPAKTFFINQWQGRDWALYKYDPEKIKEGYSHFSF